MSPEEIRARELLGRKIAKSVAADLLGVSHERFARLLADWKITWPIQNQATRVTYRGVTGTFREHSQLLGINAATLKWRWKRHGSLDPVKSDRVTPMDVARFVVYRRRGLAAWEAAERIGCHYNWLHKKAEQLFGNKYRHIVRHAPRIRRTRAQLQRSKP